MEVLNNEIAFQSIKPQSRELYRKAWNKFVQFNENEEELNTRMPTESELFKYFSHLRNVIGAKSSTMWTTYSMINSVCKSKYGGVLQQYPRITTLVKSFDVGECLLCIAKHFMPN